MAVWLLSDARRGCLLLTTSSGAFDQIPPFAAGMTVIGKTGMAGCWLMDGSDLTVSECRGCFSYALVSTYHGRIQISPAFSVIVVSRTL